ncbi:MAG: hypothetical protein IJC07_02275 [Clostridia bacterium]|nr:hypothetical protein [Clostridia bacterium]
MIENRNLNEENSQKEAYKIPTVGEILLRFEEETGGFKGLCTARVMFFWISLILPWLLLTFMAILTIIKSPLLLISPPIIYAVVGTYAILRLLSPIFRVIIKNRSVESFIAWVTENKIDLKEILATYSKEELISVFSTDVAGSDRGFILLSMFLMDNPELIKAKRSQATATALTNIIVGEIFFCATVLLGSLAMAFSSWLFGGIAIGSFVLGFILKAVINNYAIKNSIKKRTFSIANEWVTSTFLGEKDSYLKSLLETAIIS